MPLFTPGSPRLRLLNSDGTTNKTLNLPPPTRDGGVTLEWVEVSETKRLVNGSEVCLRRGWIPELTLRWKLYDDVSPTTINVGSGNGQTADMATLLAMLDAAPGRIRVSPGPTAGGFTVNRTEIRPLGIRGPGMAAGVEITLRAGKVFSAKTLEAF